MKGPDIKRLLYTAKASLGKHSPGILTGIGIAGMVTAAVLAVKATPKALKRMEAKKKKEKTDCLTAMQAVKEAGPVYIPAVITGTLSAACIIGACRVNAGRTAALATACSLSESALKDYRGKVAEAFGEKKEQAVRDAVAKEKVERNPPKNGEVIMTEKGNTLCYDPAFGRYFRSDMETIRRAENTLNQRLLSEMYVSLNEFYREVGLPAIGAGEDLGWNMNDGFMELTFSTQLTPDGTPCLVVDYMALPKYDFTRLS